MEELNEDCGCGQSAKEPNFQPSPYTQSADINVGKIATLVDGRSGVVDDAIRNSTGEVIGYVINGSKGAFRTFKEKIQSFNESEGAMATLSSTPGMGDPMLPGPDHTGSGDQFPSLTAGTPAANRQSKKKKSSRKSMLMDFEKFSEEMKKNQGE
jgi:hypothetical protein